MYICIIKLFVFLVLCMNRTILANVVFHRANQISKPRHTIGIQSPVTGQEAETSRKLLLKRTLPAAGSSTPPQPPSRTAFGVASHVLYPGESDSTHPKGLPGPALRPSKAKQASALKKMANGADIHQRREKEKSKLYKGRAALAAASLGQAWGPYGTAVAEKHHNAGMAIGAHARTLKDTGKVFHSSASNLRHDRPAAPPERFTEAASRILAAKNRAAEAQHVADSSTDDLATHYGAIKNAKERGELRAFKIVHGLARERAQQALAS